MMFKRSNNKKRFGWRMRLGAGGIALVLVLSYVLFAAKPPQAAAAIVLVSQNTALQAAAATTTTITAPTGIVAGYLLLAQTMVQPSTGSSVTTTAPTGWVKIGAAVTGSKYSLTNFYKVATASEPASYTFSYSSAATAAIGIALYSGVDSKSPIDVSNGQVNASSTTQTAPSVTTTYNTDAIITMFGYQSNVTAATIPAGFTSSYSTSTSNNGILSAYKLLTNAGSTGTFTSTTAVATGSLTQTIGLKPTAASAGVQFVAATAPNTSCASCTTITEAAPTGYKIDDLLLTSITWNTNTSTLATLSGWTQINTTQTTGAFAMAEFYHFVVVGDPSSYTWTFSAPTANAMITTADFQGVDTLAPIDTNATALSASGTSHSSPSLTTNYAQDMLVDIWGWNTGTNASTITNTMTKFFDAQSGNASANVSAAGGYELLGLSGVSGTRTVTSGRTAIAMMHSIALKAYLPTPNLIAPASGTLGITLYPIYQLVNASLSATPLQYKIQLCSTATCSSIITTYDQTVSQTGWSGQDANAGTAYIGSATSSSSTTATFTTQTALTPGTQYWWRGLSYDTGSLQLGNPSNIFTFTTSAVPSAPSLFNPGVNASGIPLKPEFRIASTDADADYLRYKIDLCANITCTTIIATYNQSSSQLNWTGQDSNNFTAYSSDPTLVINSTLAYYTQATDLTPSTQYYWRAYAIDPAGTNTYSPASAIQSFTTNLNETRILNGTIKSGRIL